MIVIGDAAHATTSPSSGQGASMVIEDAVVLARCLRDLPETGRAVAASERLRRRRVERIVAHGTRTSNSKAAGGSLAWMHDYHIDWDEEVAAAERSRSARDENFGNYPDPASYIYF